MSNETMPLIHIHAPQASCKRCGSNPRKRVVPSGRIGAVNIYTDRDDLYHVFCQECEYGTDMCSDLESAIAAWNKRQGESDE